MAVCTDDFYSLVKRMRRWQRNYFRTRSKEALVMSKEIEAQVDGEIEEYEAFNCVIL